MLHDQKKFDCKCIFTYKTIKTLKTLCLNKIDLIEYIVQKIFSGNTYFIQNYIEGSEVCVQIFLLYSQYLLYNY